MIHAIQSNSKFTRDEIRQQLQKVITDPLFAVSTILQRFLHFIVEETLEGRSNQIKEYTIGINVLSKSVNFNPKQDAIVRIHAGRLRRALNHYYQGAGLHDPICITIPKGSYMPKFSDSYSGRLDENIIVHHEEGANHQPSNVPAEAYMVTADMQYLDNRLKISVRMLNAESHEEIWSQLVEYKVAKSNDFDIQEDIAKKLMTAISDYCKLIKQQAPGASVMAVA